MSSYITNDASGAYEGLMQFLYRAPIGLLQTDIDGAIDMINPMSAQLLMPLSQDGSLNNLFTALSSVAPDLRETVANFHQSAGVVCESARFQIPADMRHSEPLVLSVSILKLNEHSLMAVIMDVTLEAMREQRGLERELKDAARVDTLTQMPNRSVVLERIEQAIEVSPGRAGYEFAVLLINCDRFKRINDVLGREVGDQVLTLMAERLRSVQRSQDRGGRRRAPGSMTARNGGDEFVVVLDDLSRAAEVEVVAQRLLDTLNMPYRVGNHQIHNSVSIGIVLRAQAQGNADAILQKASIAVAEAKRAGAGRYVIFEAAMQERAAQRGGIEADLRVALDEGQLFVVYQPVVDLQGFAGIAVCTGVEALVRWRHPTRGVVPPLEFIPIAEECGLIGRIGDFVLSTACQQFVEWQQRLGSLAPRTLAVNLSRAQLFQPDLTATVRATLQSCAMRAGQLQLEVTESLAAQDETVRSRLHELKALHLTLALDDFGTGYSSLASLHLLPVDTIKIDRSFVSQAHDSQHHRVLIEATVKVANSLGMSTVAEGIETEAQADIVRKLGVDKGQGYFYSRPLLPIEFVAWLRAQKRNAPPPHVFDTATPAQDRMAR